MTDPVERYRAASTAVLGITRRIHAGDAGHTKATLHALERHARTMAEALDCLAAGGRRTLVGLLVEEDVLRARLLDARLDGEGNRPELAARLSVVRRGIAAARKGDQ